MQFGLQLNSQHPAIENMRDRLEELLEQVRLAQAVGFHSIVAPQHFLPAPFQMLQPLPLLARMAAEADRMRLIAGILLLSLQNPVALAEDVGTLDAICDGQFTLGVALEQLLRYHERLGANHFLLRVQWAGMPQKQVLEAITLVGERVIPYLCDV